MTPELLHLSNRLFDTEMVLPSDLAVSSCAEEADVVERVFAGRRWQLCPWYLFDLDPSLVSAVERCYLVHLAWGYIAAGMSFDEVLNSIADRVEPVAASDLDAILEVEIRQVLSKFKTDDLFRRN